MYIKFNDASVSIRLDNSLSGTSDFGLTSAASELDLAKQADVDAGAGVSRDGWSHQLPSVSIGTGHSRRACHPGCVRPDRIHYSDSD